MKLRSVLLISCVVFSFACQSKSSLQSESAVQQTSQPIKPAGTADPTIGVGDPSNPDNQIGAAEEPVEVTFPDLATLKVTSDTGFSLPHSDSVEDFETKFPDDLHEPNCVTAKKYPNYGVTINKWDINEFIGDISFIGVPLSSKFYGYCQNGAYSEYENYVIVKIFVIASIWGDVPLGESEFMLDTRGQFSPRLMAWHPYLFNANELSKGGYLLLHSLVTELEGLGFPDENRPGGTADIPYEVTDPDYMIDFGGPGLCGHKYCSLYRDIPKTIGDLRAEYSKVGNDPNYRGRIRGNRRLTENHEKFLRQSHGKVGEPCNREEDIRRRKEKWAREEEERRIFLEKTTPKQKKVPCDEDPSGYCGEDWEIGEYLKEQERLIREYKKGVKK